MRRLARLRPVGVSARRLRARSGTCEGLCAARPARPRARRRRRNAPPHARIGRFRLRLGNMTGRGDVAGFVSYSTNHCKPRDVLLMALAGPAESLAGSVVTAFGFLAAWPQPELAWVLGSA